MRKIKIIVYSLCVIISFLILGELYVYNLDSFSNDYINCTFAVNQVEDLSVAKKDFVDIAKKYNLGIFTLENKLPKEKRKEYHIYGNEIGLKKLQKTFNKKGAYNSLVAGEAEVIFHDWKELENVDSLKVLFFTNDVEDLAQIREFKKELIDQYGGGFPKYYGKSNTLRNTTILMLSIVYLVLILITTFELQISKKENYIKLIQGVDIVKSNLKLFLKDQLILGMITAILYFFIKRFYYLEYIRYYLAVAYSLQLLLVLLLYLRTANKIERTGIRAENNNTVVKISYGVRVLVLLILIQLMYSNGLIIKNGLDYAKQKSFFENHKEYSYYQLNYRLNNSLGKDIDNTDDTALLHKYLNDKYYERSMLMFNFSRNLGGMESILVNKKALEEQEIQLPLHDLKEGTDLAVFYQSDLSDYTKEEIERVLELYYPSNSKIDYVQYKDNIEIIAINDTNSLLRSVLLESPLVILETRNMGISISNADARLYYAYSTPYDLSGQEYEELIEKFQLENQITKRTNIYEVFTFELNNIRRNTTMLLFMNLLFLGLNFLILAFIIRMQYFLRRKEFVLKTILGYSIFEKNKIFLSTQALTVLISLLISCIIYIHLSVFSLKVFMLLAILLIALEIIYTMIQVKSNEEILLAHIIKGGQ